MLTRLEAAGNSLRTIRLLAELRTLRSAITGSTGRLTLVRNSLVKNRLYSLASVPSGVSLRALRSAITRDCALSNIGLIRTKNFFVFFLLLIFPLNFSKWQWISLLRQLKNKKRTALAVLFC